MALDFALAPATAGSGGPPGRGTRHDRRLRLRRLARADRLRRGRHRPHGRDGGGAGLRPRARPGDGPHQEADAEALADRLGPLAAGVFAEAAMPYAGLGHRSGRSRRCARRVRTARSRSAGVRPLGLGKAIAYRLDTPQIAYPDDLRRLGRSRPSSARPRTARKTTLKSPRVLPEIVLYDPGAGRWGLPSGMTVTSALNALAHARGGALCEGRELRSPSLMAAEGVRAFVGGAARSWPGGRATFAARTRALYGAWLCGTVLGRGRHGAAPQALPHRSAAPST